jgi:hypothetical protein
MRIIALRWRKKRSSIAVHKAMPATAKRRREREPRSPRIPITNPEIDMMNSAAKIGRCVLDVADREIPSARRPKFIAMNPQIAAPIAKDAIAIGGWRRRVDGSS